MTEIFDGTTPEEQERLTSGRMFNIDVPSDFNYDTGIILVLPLGSHSACFIDPYTGELPVEAEAAEVIRRQKKVGIYSVDAKHGDRVLVQLRDRFSNGSERDTNVVVEYGPNSNWFSVRTGLSASLNLVPGFENKTVSWREKSSF